MNDRNVGAHQSVRADKWTAAGATKIFGDVDVLEGSVSGTTSVGGKLFAERLRSSGSLEVQGEVRVKTALLVNGNARFGGAVTVCDADLRGHVEVHGAFAAERALTWKGSLDSTGDLSARNLWFDGRFRVHGDLRAHEVEGRLTGDSQARALRAEFVRISRGGLPFREAGSARFERIEATTVFLEGVECEYLWADRIVLGPNCHIARLDGNLVSRHSSSHVGPESRSRAPYGIWR
ncbi:MAG: hypothetical protein L3K09_01190 [Thermoplasmata archaeon]|nr:hypothetical protein [Thermoplasmata archaeon]